jgi:hypothetical protein
MALSKRHFSGKQKEFLTLQNLIFLYVFNMNFVRVLASLFPHLLKIVAFFLALLIALSN